VPCMPRRAVSAVVICGWALFFWLCLGGLLQIRRPCSDVQRLNLSILFCGNDLPVPVLTAFDLMLAFLGVLVRALSSHKTGNLPFFHACSRKGSVRGFLSLLNLVQAIHLHACASLERTSFRMLSALLTTLPWWMDRQGGWYIVMSGASSFGEAVNEPILKIHPARSVLSLLVSHVVHLHGLFFGLNLTVALSHFREDPGVRRIVDLPHFRAYWLWLHAATGCDVVFQALVDRRWLSASLLPWLTALCSAPALFFALPVLVDHVSEVSAAMSFLLWYLREHRALSSTLLCLLWTEAYEVTALLVARYNLVA